MKVKLTKALAGRDAGDTIETTTGAAERLISEGVAEAVNGGDDKPRRKRPAKGEGVGDDSPSPAKPTTAG